MYFLDENEKKKKKRGGGEELTRCTRRSKASHFLIISL